ncbi:ApeA N-terminal domain 1-containing protein [Streptomyces sp. SAS_270]|uniref:ApeA N-terminal domain 1-containing protein n=1 Tax=Streptomyces sp. SAS_270 TaxID=3412748 RepID=UPI00403D3E3F
MEYFSAGGSWWLPGHEHESLPGTLTFDSAGISLVVYGGSLFRPAVVANDGSGEQWSHWVEEAVVHGRLHEEDRRDVSLLGVAGLTVSSDLDVEQEACRVELALLGWHADGNAFSEAKVDFDYLNAWLHPPPLWENAPNRISVHTDDIELTSAPIESDRVRLIAGCSGNRRWSRTTGDVVRVERRSVFAIDCADPSRWEDIVDSRIRPFHDLLMLSLDRPVRITGIRLRPVGTGQGSPQLCDAYLSVLQRPSTSLHAIVGANAPTLLRANDSPVDLATLLPRWYCLWRNFWEPVRLLLAPEYAPFMYTAHKFTSTYRSAEALAKALFDSKQIPRPDHNARVQAVINSATSAGIDAEVIEWAKAVLQSRNDKPQKQLIEELVKSTGEVGATIVHAAPEFVARVARTRGRESHGGSTSGTPNVVQLHWYGEVLRWIIRTRMLSELGIDDIESRVLEREPFRYAVDQVRE